MAPADVTPREEGSRKTNRRKCRDWGKPTFNTISARADSPRGGPTSSSAWRASSRGWTRTTSTTPRRAGAPARAASWPTSRPRTAPRPRRRRPSSARRRRASRTSPSFLQMRCGSDYLGGGIRRGAQGDGAVPPRNQHRRGGRAGGHCRRGRVLRGDDFRSISRGRPRERIGWRPRHGRYGRHVNTRKRRLDLLWHSGFDGDDWNVDRWCHDLILEQPRVRVAHRVRRRRRADVHRVPPGPGDVVEVFDGSALVAKLHGFDRAWPPLRDRRHDRQVHDGRRHGARLQLRVDGRLERFLRRGALVCAADHSTCGNGKCDAASGLCTWRRRQRAYCSPRPASARRR